MTDTACSRGTSDLTATLRTTSAQLPDHWWSLPIKRGNVRLDSFFGLTNATHVAAPSSAPMTLGAWLSGTHGDASGFWFLSLMADLVFPQAEVWGNVAATSRVDVSAARRYFAAGRHGGLNLAACFPDR